MKWDLPPLFVPSFTFFSFKKNLYNFERGSDQGSQGFLLESYL